MLKDKNTERWIEYAQNDLLVAKSLVEQDDYVNRAVLTHCQQSIEKYLKAYALMNRLGLKKIHDLVALSKICEQVNERFKQFEREFAWMNNVYINTRYPGDFEDYDKETALIGLSLATKFEDFFFQIIAEEENS